MWCIGANCMLTHFPGVNASLGKACTCNHMLDGAVRSAIGLRVGAPICLPHPCSSCGHPVDEFGHHGLSCRFSKGRVPRHHMLNGIIHHSLASVNIPSRLEPSNLFRADMVCHILAYVQRNYQGLHALAGMCAGLIALAIDLSQLTGGGVFIVDMFIQLMCCQVNLCLLYNLCM